MPQTLVLPDLSVDLVRAAQVIKGALKSVPVAELRRLEMDYRRFLALVAEHQDQTLAPTQAIDEMWHLHMLHPVAYHRDCMAFLGYLLYHDAGFGAIDEERPVLHAHFDRTGNIWRQAFGREYQGLGNDPVFAVTPPPTCTSKPKPVPEPEVPIEPEGEPEQGRGRHSVFAVTPPPTCTARPKPMPEPEAPIEPEGEPEQGQDYRSVFAVTPPPTCTTKPKPAPEPEAPIEPEDEPEQNHAA